MKKLDERLKQDAAAIDAELPPAFSNRLEAALDAVDAERRNRRRAPTSGAGGRWWWLASLTGAAAALLLIVLANRPPGPGELPANGPQPGVADTPAPPVQPILVVPLAPRTADFTEPLAEELENLKSDLDKARESVEQDLRLTF